MLFGPQRIEILVLESTTDALSEEELLHITWRVIFCEYQYTMCRNISLKQVCSLWNTNIYACVHWLITLSKYVGEKYKDVYAMHYFCLYYTLRNNFFRILIQYSYTYYSLQNNMLIVYGTRTQIEWFGGLHL